jgi:hypothetical protein
VKTLPRQRIRNQQYENCCVRRPMLNFTTMAKHEKQGFNATTQYSVFLHSRLSLALRCVSGRTSLTGRAATGAINLHKRFEFRNEPTRTENTRNWLNHTVKMSEHIRHVAYNILQTVVCKRTNFITVPIEE